MKEKAEIFYSNAIKSFKENLDNLRRNASLLGWSRLAVMIALALTIYYTWQYGFGVVIVSGIALLGVFLFLVAKSLAVNGKIENFKRLISVHENELLILSGKYTHQPDGEIYLSNLKLTDNDLDLFGHASLFQYVNRANGHHGSLALAKSFVEKPTEDIIWAKQEAVKELSHKIDWCKQLQAHSLIAPVSKKTEDIIMEWLDDDKGAFEKPIWKILRYLVPAVSWGILILYIADKITDGLFNTLILLMLAFVYSFSKKFTKQYNHISTIVPELNALLPTLQWIEHERFQSSHLNDGKARLSAHDLSASKSIASLKSILERFDYRLNPVVHIPLSLFLFWDLQQVLALEQWKKQQHSHLATWFDTMGEFEMLGSLATLTFNQPDWTFPVISEKWFEVECKAIGHPLIKKEKLVVNDFSLSGTPQIAIITGSNMAGKSTFLRTVGINMILAMAGAPVKATHMKVPVVSILSSMRIMDNLEEETSTFYAELKKMKRIVEAAKRKEKVFILIDEMLRGTNTLDRHTGSIALTRQLVKHDAVGIIASHDLGLAALENDYPNAIENYHFDSSIIGEEIIFDYTLKSGICQSTNAYLLMKKIGIEMEQNDKKS